MLIKPKFELNYWSNLRDQFDEIKSNINWNQVPSEILRIELKPQTLVYTIVSYHSHHYRISNNFQCN